MVMNPVREKNEIANQVKIKPLIKGTSSVTSSLSFIQVFWKPQHLLSGHMVRNHFCLVANIVVLCSFQKVVGKAGTCLSSPNVAGVQSPMVLIQLITTVKVTIFATILRHLGNSYGTPTVKLTAKTLKNHGFPQ